MHSDRGSILTIVAVAAGAAGGFLGLAWPHYRHTAAINDEIAYLDRRIATSEEQQVSLSALAERFAQVKSEHDEKLRDIPSSPDMGGLMRALTVETDKELVIDQTITNGRPAADPAVADGSITIQPLTIDMTARFEPLFDLVARAEQMNRLVRVSSLVLERNKEDDEVLDATIRLEAIYETQADDQEVE